jgi:sarcosine oxidase
MSIPRRTFLQLAGVSSVTLGSRSMPQGAPLAEMFRRPAQGSASPEIVVVGAGAFGGWTALYLREMGHAVTLVDAYGPGNSRAASGDETRQIRAGYGDRAIYTRWVLKAFERWKARQAEWGRTLFLETGRLVLSPEWTSGLQTTKTTLDKEGVATEVMKDTELSRRYPQMSVEGVGVALFEPSTGVLMAREGCIEVARAFERKGGRMVIAQAALGTRSGRRLENISLGGKDPLGAQTFVFACGPWIAKIFPEVMAKKLFTPRRDVFYFGTPAGDDRFSYPNFPNYSEDFPAYSEESDEGFYGFPSIDYRGFKVCPAGERTALDPDTDERIASPFYIKRAKEYVAKRFPPLRNQPILESRVCQLEMSVDSHFIIQRHPDFDNVWIACGGSGHGYKHGPVVGEYIANRVTGRESDSELEKTFQLKPATFDR